MIYHVVSWIRFFLLSYTHRIFLADDVTFISFLGVVLFRPMFVAASHIRGFPGLVSGKMCREALELLIKLWLPLKGSLQPIHHIH